MLNGSQLVTRQIQIRINIKKFYLNPHDQHGCHNETQEETSDDHPVEKLQNADKHHREDVTQI